MLLASLLDYFLVLGLLPGRLILVSEFLIVGDCLVIHQKYRISYDEITNDLCPILSVQQLYRICTLYWDDNYNTRSVAPNVISSMRVLMTEDSNDAASSSFLLDDNSSIPFSVDDLSISLQEKDFLEVKPAEELLENQAFQFLHE